MRRVSVFFSAILLIALSLGLGALAQEPTTTVSSIYPVGVDGCLVVPKPSDVWTLTKGDWDKPVVKDRLKDINPRLAEPAHQFDWEGHGIGSGIYIYPGDRLCGFTPTFSATHDPSISTDDVVGKLRAERDAATAKIEDMLARLQLLFIALVVALIAAIVLWAMKKEKTQASAFWKQAAEDRSTDAMVERGRHAQEIEELAGVHDATIAEIEKRHATEIAAIHASYNPYDGVPVIAGGLAPTPDNALKIEATMLLSTYNLRGDGNESFLPFAEAIRTGLFRRIGPITFGYLNGNGIEVQNGDATSGPKNLRNQPGYRTRVRFPNGTEEDAYCLQACCNPIVRGDFIRPGDNFTFTPAPVGAEILPAPPIPDTPTSTVGELVGEFPTPTGGRILGYGPGPVSSAVSEHSLTVTVRENVAESAETPVLA